MNPILLELPTKTTQSLVIPIDKKDKYIVTISAEETLTLENYHSSLSQLFYSRPDLMLPFGNTAITPAAVMKDVYTLAVWCDSRGMRVDVKRKSRNKFVLNVCKFIYFLTGKMI
jgi:hypothetical protein